eukprot:5719258-Pleurochrysis_carterae.AAC.2
MRLGLPLTRLYAHVRVKLCIEGRASRRKIRQARYGSLGSSGDFYACRPIVQKAEKRTQRKRWPLPS